MRPASLEETDFTPSDPADGRMHCHAHELGQLATSVLGVVRALESQSPRFLDENFTTRAMPGLTRQSLGTSHSLGPGSPLASCSVSVGSSGRGGRRARQRCINVGRHNRAGCQRCVFPRPGSLVWWTWLQTDDGDGLKPISAGVPAATSPLSTWRGAFRSCQREMLL